MASSHLDRPGPSASSSSEVVKRSSGRRGHPQLDSETSAFLRPSRPRKIGLKIGESTRGWNCQVLGSPDDNCVVLIGHDIEWFIRSSLNPEGTVTNPATSMGNHEPTPRAEVDPFTSHRMSVVESGRSRPSRTPARCPAPKTNRAVNSALCVSKRHRCCCRGFCLSHDRFVAFCSVISEMAVLVRQWI